MFIFDGRSAFVQRICHRGPFQSKGNNRVIANFFAVVRKLRGLTLRQVLSIAEGWCAGCRAAGTGSTEQLQVRKLEDNYFENWPAGTELGRERFKQLLRIELRRWELGPFPSCHHNCQKLELQQPMHVDVIFFVQLIWCFESTDTSRELLDGQSLQTLLQKNSQPCR